MSRSKTIAAGLIAAGLALPFLTAPVAPQAFANSGGSNDKAEKAADKISKNAENALKQAGWKLVWSDEFDEDFINPENWSHEVNCFGGGNNELQCYTDRQDNSYVSDGQLHIVAKEELYSGPALSDDDPSYNSSDTSKTLPFTSARLRTKGKVDFRYGRVDVRAQLPAGQGMWPAIWMLPTNNTYGIWPASGEIDIVEGVNLGVWANEIHGTLHYGLPWPQWENNGLTLPLPYNPADDFHTYSVEWDEDEIRWYFDGVHYQTQQSEGWYNYIWQGQEIGFAPANERAPFDQDFHVILNVAVGGDWPGTPDREWDQDRQMLVDYVRVYECKHDRERGNSDGMGQGKKVGHQKSCATIEDAAVVNNGTGAPQINDFPVYSGGPQTFEFEVAGETVTNTLVPGQWELEAGNVIQNFSNGLWDITFNGVGNAFLASDAMEENPLVDPGFSLAGGAGWHNNGELEFDMLVVDADPEASLLIKLDSGYPDQGQIELALPPSDGEWHHVVLKVADFLASPNPSGSGVNLGDVRNLIVLENSAGFAQVQIDNVHLQCAVNSQPADWQLDKTCGIEPRLAPFEPEGDSLVVYEDAITNWNVLNCCGGVEIQEIFFGGSNVMRFAFDNDPGTNTVAFFQSESPSDLSDYAGGTVEFDMYVVSQPEPAAEAPWMMKVDCEFPCGTGDVPLSESQEGVLPPTGSWQHYTFSISDLVARGLELSHVDTPLVIFPTWGSQNGAEFYIDNVRWEKGDGSPPPPAGPVLTVYDDNFTDWLAYDCCGGASISEESVDGDNAIRITFDTDPGTNTVTFLQSASPLDLRAWAGGTVEFDMFVLTQNPGTPWMMKVDCVFPCGTGDVPIDNSVEGTAPATGVWQHFTFRIDDLVSRGLDLGKVDTPLVIFPAWGVQNGEDFYIDNVEWIQAP